MSVLNRKEFRRRIHRRIRKKIRGTGEKPRLAIHCSNKNIYAQIIDDDLGRTVCSASTVDREIEGGSSNIDSAIKVGTLVANRAKEKNVSQVVFDRGGHLYHGKVKSLADAAREAGLQF